MKKLPIFIVILCLLLVNIFVVNAAQGELIYSEPFGEIYSNYECSFEVELDNSFKNTWIYDISDNGILSVKLESIRTPRYGSDVLATFSGRTTKQYTDSGHRTTFGRGVYDFKPNYSVVEDGNLNQYASDDSLRLRIILEKDDGVTKITMYLYNGSIINGVAHKSSSVISYIADSFKEEGMADSMFNINGASDQYHNLSPDDNELDNNERTDEDTKLDEKQEIDNRDSKHEDSINAQIEKYSKYEKDGITYAVSILRGNLLDAKLDYRIDVTAEFSIEDNRSDISKSVSTDGKLTLTYYNVVRTADGKYWMDRQLLKIKGDKDEQWFSSSRIEARRANPSVEIDLDSHLTDDSSIYMSFGPVTFVDDSILPNVTAVQNVVGDKDALSLTFQYSDESKTHMEAVQVKMGSTTATVKIDDIDYKGGFISYFLQMVYPSTWKEIAKEIGVTI